MTPGSVRRPSRLASIADDMQLTIRLFIRRYALHGGAFPLISLGEQVKPGLEKDVARANAIDAVVTGMFSQC
jgi:hypothetical protein